MRGGQVDPSSLNKIKCVLHIIRQYLLRYYTFVFFFIFRNHLQPQVVFFLHFSFIYVILILDKRLGLLIWGISKNTHSNNLLKISRRWENNTLFFWRLFLMKKWFVVGELWYFLYLSNTGKENDFGKFLTMTRMSNSFTNLSNLWGRLNERYYKIKN